MTISGARHRPKIGYGRVPATDEYLDYGDLARIALGPGDQLTNEWRQAGLTLPDESAMRRYRLGRVRDQLRANNCDAILLYDPINIRYATDTTNMSIWTSYNHVRYCLVFADGPVVMFEFSHGEFLETRILASGPRTNPWYHESSSRVIEAGDLMGFDTDLIGAYGMCIDMSRTWRCGGGAPTAAQQSTYSLALEQIERNLQLQPGMVMCVEAFVGPKAGGEGVKLEQQILITDSGHELLTPYPLELS